MRPAPPVASTVKSARMTSTLLSSSLNTYAPTHWFIRLYLKSRWVAWWWVLSRSMAVRLVSTRMFGRSATARANCCMRVLDQKNIIGCNFEAMERRQEIKLDKLVLEVQKRLIELRKAKREAAE